MQLWRQRRSQHSGFELGIQTYHQDPAKVSLSWRIVAPPHTPPAHSCCQNDQNQIVGLGLKRLMFCWTGVCEKTHPQSGPQRAQTGGVSSQLQNPEDPHQPEHLKEKT